MEKELIEYFIKKTDHRFDQVDRDFYRLEKKIDSLLAFKWQALGALLVINVIIIFAMQMTGKVV